MKIYFISKALKIATIAKYPLLKVCSLSFLHLLESLRAFYPPFHTWHIQLAHINLFPEVSPYQLPATLPSLKQKSISISCKNF